jgi:hypothetical protein
MRRRYATVDLTSKVKEKIMSLSEVENQQELKQELDVLNDQVEQDQKSDHQKTIVSWIVSGVTHACIFLLAMTIAFTVADVDEELPPLRVTSIPPPPHKQPEEDIKKRELLEKKDVLIESELESNDKGPVSMLELPEELVTSTEDETDTPTEMPRGREEAKSDMEFGGQGFLAMIGTGGNAGGMFGNRTGGGRNRAKAKMGPYGKKAESSTDAGLRWLKRHQSPNGMWSATKYFENCTVGLKCEPGKDASGDEDVAMTGYAVLCFLGQGHDHKTPSHYKTVVKKAIDYLISVQKPDGLLGERNYEHPVAAMALVEAYAMSNDPELRKPAQLAVDMILQRQSRLTDDEYSRIGWDYVRPNAKRNDISVSGWNVMALKSAVAAGLSVGEGLTGAKKFLDGAWKAANPNWAKLSDPYKDKSVFPYTWNAEANTTEREHLSFVGSTCAVFLGHRSGDIMLESLLNDGEERWIKSGAYKNNNYACYYLSLASFQGGGDRWKLCLETLIPYSIDTQRASNDCFDGSWDYQNQNWHGADTGRVLSTCYNILNLQVAYRYAQVNQEVKLKKMR